MSSETVQPVAASQPVALSYEVNIPKQKTPTAGFAMVLVIAGLGLIFLGGCFLMGIMAFYYPQVFTNGITTIAPTLTPKIIVFLLILYALAGGCFLSALLILGRTVRLLFDILSGQ